MPAPTRGSEPLVLLPMPLSTAQKMRRKQFLTKKLKQYPLEQIAVQEIYKIYSWRRLNNSPTKRLYRNYSLAYSLQELQNRLLASYKYILDLNS